MKLYANGKIVEIASGHEYAKNVEQAAGDAQQVKKGGRKHGRTSRKP